jgi:dienelactone hydrolase/tRNA A-37 threonylcarbamoyl transferase component Bud32
MRGTLVSHYRVIDKIGEGGMGVVYLAEDERLARKVALKFITPSIAADAAARARLLREARTASALDHPNIATVYEVGEWNGQLFLALAYYAGETLKDRIARGPLPIPEAASIAEQIAQGLAAAHAATIVHRDLKPANVIITPAGVVKILDFGLAKPAGPLAETVVDVTAAGAVTGTLAYMAPEQARGAYADPSVDIWALGAVLFEMLSGRSAFAGNSQAATLTAILTAEPPPVRTLRPEVPHELERLVQRALVKDPGQRTLTAAEAAGALAAHRDSVRLGTGGRPMRRYAIPVAILVLLAVAALVPWTIRASNRRWAKSALPDIRRLAGLQNAAAVDLASQAERYIPGDPELTRLWPSIARSMSIQSEPAGADISYMEYGSTGPWRSAGQTPLKDARFPLGWLRVRIVKAGFDSAEDVVGNFVGQGATSVARFVLTAAGTGPDGMVRAARTPSPFAVYVLGLELPRVQLNPFWIDRQEVTNRQFKAFVAAGGYGRREYWQHPFAGDGRILSWEAAMALFRDATGRPGPAGWELGSYPSGQEDLPVSGVSWYEAAAYAAFAGKSLPTVYHWSWVATQPLVGFVIPFAHFNSKAPIRADASSALHRFGAVNLAGNVKEWTVNDARNGQRYILGGGFDDPPYMFADADARSPLERAPNFGFRCMKLDADDPSLAVLSRRIESPSRNYNTETPASDEVFAAYTRIYSYDRTDLNAAVEGTDDANPDWRVEKVTFTAGYPHERVIAYVFLPKSAKPPYQTAIYMPPANAWDLRSSAALVANPPFSYLVRSGRAVVLPIYKGTFERGTDDIKSDLRKDSNAWRDHVILLSKDISRTVDYLLTRQDIDHDRLAYVGTSRGAALAPVLLALEPRFQAAALWIPGLYLERPAPEVDAVNFAPRVKIPVLVLSGRYDYNFPDEASSRPFFERLGTPPEHKRRILYDTGHNLPFNEAVKETLNWFDTCFGAVR